MEPATNRPMHFEIHCDDVDRAEKFYTGLFGWEIKKWENPGMDYRLITTGSLDKPGINGALMKRMGPPPASDAPVHGYVVTMAIPNIDESIAKAKELGGIEAWGKNVVPGVGWLAYYKDTEGNIFGMIQPDENAK